MVRDAESHAEEDRMFEELVTARNTADGMIHATRKTLEEAGDKVGEEEKANIESAIADLEQAMKEDKKSEIDSKTQKLTEVSSELAQRMYAEQSQSAEAGAAPGQSEAGGSGGGDPDAVDAEFEEVKEDKQA
jgi:molecular chaperone DnaK